MRRIGRLGLDFVLWKTADCQCDPGFASHRVDIGERICRGDRPVLFGIVHDGRYEIHRESELRRPAGVDECGIIHCTDVLINPRVRDGTQFRQDLTQALSTKLARSTTGGNELGQSNFTHDASC